MANITEEHLHHMARRHHQTMKRLEGIREKVAARLSGFVGTLEIGAGSWIGGVIEGRTGGGALPVLKVPINLGIGLGLLAAGHLEAAGPEWSNHLNNLGSGFIGSYVAATGYAFGKRWKETGKILGGGGHPWISPYEDGWPKGAGAAAVGAVHDDLSPEQMANIVQRMQQAAAYG